MSETLPQRAETSSSSPAAPLTRKIKARTAAQERAERQLLEARLAWDINKAVSEAPSATPQQEQVGQPDWASLLVATNKHSAGAWVLLDKALAPFCMGAPGPMDPKTGQYVTEIRMTRNQRDQIEKVRAGIEALLPFLKRTGGRYEFRIKCLGLKYKEKVWLSFSKDGKAQVLSTLQSAVSFDDLQQALVFICEQRPAAESAQ